MTYGRLQLMATTTGIWNHSMAAVNPLADTNPRSNASSSDGSSTAAASTISANDFLTLLVTEMKNQDPTANNDPNQYINQLVQVNSLEQLIDINQNLRTVLDGSSTGTNPPATGHGVSAANPASVRSTSAPAGATAAHRASQAPQAVSATDASTQNVRAGLPTGNLTVPNASPAAHRVAQALSGRH
jgi:flagellar basal-body rod modification protein FlgD